MCPILDKRSAHGDGLPQFPGVEYIFLPSKVTAVYQSLHMGVLVALKNKSRQNLLSKITVCRVASFRCETPIRKKWH